MCKVHTTDTLGTGVQPAGERSTRNIRLQTKQKGKWTEEITEKNESDPRKEIQNKTLSARQTDSIHDGYAVLSNP